MDKKEIWKIRYQSFTKRNSFRANKKNPYKRVDNENMIEIEKMDKGFNRKTFSINRMDIDFWVI